MRLVLACATSLLFALLTTAQPADPVPTDPDQAAVDAAIAKAGAGAVVAAIITPEGTRFYAAGRVSAENPAPPSPDTLFEIGSLTKGFTGLLLAQMELAGELSADDTLSARLTDWPKRAEKPAGAITLRELATHHSGLPRMPLNLNLWVSNPYAEYDPASLHAWLDFVKPAKKKTYAYSNVGYGTLGHALERTANTPYETLLVERIFNPLKLADTRIQLSDSQRARLASGHEGRKPAENWDFQVLAAAGALRSTAADLARFARQALDLEPNPLRAPLDHATRDLAPVDENRRVGYGWMRTYSPRGRIHWHNGSTAGYCSMLGWLPERRLAIVVLASNSQLDADTLFSKLLRPRAPIQKSVVTQTR